LHMAQLMPLPLAVSCFSKIQIGFSFLVLAYSGTADSPGQRAVKRCVCVCVCASVRPCVRACVWPHCSGASSNTVIHPSVCPSPRCAAALSYRHAGCMQLSHVRTADPSANRRRSAASQTAIGGGHIISPPPGR